MCSVVIPVCFWLLDFCFLGYNLKQVSLASVISATGRWRQQDWSLKSAWVKKIRPCLKTKQNPSKNTHNWSKTRQGITVQSPNCTVYAYIFVARQSSYCGGSGPPKQELWELPYLKDTDLKGQMSPEFTSSVCGTVRCLLQMWGFTEWRYTRHTAEGWAPSDVTPPTWNSPSKCRRRWGRERHPEAQADCPCYPWWHCGVWPGEAQWEDGSARHNKWPSYKLGAGVMPKPSLSRGFGTV